MAISARVYLLVVTRLPNKPQASYNRIQMAHKSRQGSKGGLIKRLLGSDINPSRKLERSTLIVSVFVFAGIGAVVLYRSFAAGPIMSLQGEGTSTTRSGNLSVQNDSTASNSSYVRFGQVATSPGPTGQKCIVFLHGKGGGAGGSWMNGDTRIINPGGNADGWGGKQWLYFPDSRYNEVVSIVQNAINSNSCGRVIVHGFSNGGAAAAKLYCRGETFGGKMIGYIIDDPVPDAGTNNCLRPANIQRVLYWTGSLASTAYDGWNCSWGDWTCEGGYTIGIDKMQSNLGVTRKQSIYTTHDAYMNPPEYSSWW